MLEFSIDSAALSAVQIVSVRGFYFMQDNAHPWP